jgi:hypothetical protein
MPNPPTAATLAMLVPIVIARRRATARSRSPGLRRDVAFMRALCTPVSFGFVTGRAHRSERLTRQPPTHDVSGLVRPLAHPCTRRPPRCRSGSSPGSCLRDLPGRRLLDRPRSLPGLGDHAGLDWTWVLLCERRHGQLSAGLPLGPVGARVGGQRNRRFDRDERRDGHGVAPQAAGHCRRPGDRGSRRAYGRSLVRRPGGAPRCWPLSLHPGHLVRLRSLGTGRRRGCVRGPRGSAAAAGRLERARPRGRRGRDPRETAGRDRSGDRPAGPASSPPPADRLGARADLRDAPRDPRPPPGRRARFGRARSGPTTPGDVRRAGVRRRSHRSRSVRHPVVRAGEPR